VSAVVGEHQYVIDTDSYTRVYGLWMNEAQADDPITVKATGD
jgi:hypothetical protein